MASTVVPGSSAKGRPLHARLNVDESAGGRIHRLAVQLEVSPAGLDEVELLLLVLRVGLVVLIDEPVARFPRGPGVDAEGLDAEVMPDRPPRTAPVRDLVDLLEVYRREPAHGIWTLAV
jgi:hypothetical protein